MIVFSHCCLEAQANPPRRIVLRDSNMISSLALTLRSSKVSYSLGEDLSLDATLRNEGSIDRIFLYDRLRWGTGSGLGLTIEDMRGNEVRQPVMMDDLPPPPLPNDSAILVGLSLGQFFGISLIQPAHNLFPAPGKYRLRVIYSSVLYPDLVDSGLRHLNVLWEGHAPIASPWITITITP